MSRSGKLPWSAITPSANLVPTMAFLLAFLLIVGAAAAGCGAESNGTTTTDPFKSPMQSWRESLEKAADAWDRPFGTNSRRACDYMEPALCEFWIRPGSPRAPVQREFASTSVDCLDVDFDRDRAFVRFRNGEVTKWKLNRATGEWELRGFPVPTGNEDVSLPGLDYSRPTRDVNGFRCE